MKIVKQIPSKKWENYIWGLGDDGELYGRRTTGTNPYYLNWIKVEDSRLTLLFSFSEMVFVVKEFGHLVVFT